MNSDDEQIDAMVAALRETQPDAVSLTIQLKQIHQNAEWFHAHYAMNMTQVLGLMAAVRQALTALEDQLEEAIDGVAVRLEELTEESEATHKAINRLRPKTPKLTRAKKTFRPHKKP